MQCKGPYAFSIGYKTRVAPDRTQTARVALWCPGSAARRGYILNETLQYRQGRGRIVRVDSTVFGWFAWRAYGGGAKNGNASRSTDLRLACRHDYT